MSTEKYPIMQSFAHSEQHTEECIRDFANTIPESRCYCRHSVHVFDALRTELKRLRDEQEELARKVCLALGVFPEAVEDLIGAATEYDDLVDSTPESDPTEVVSWDELCHDAYQSAEKVLAALTPAAEEGQAANSGGPGQ